MHLQAEQLMSAIEKARYDQSYKISWMPRKAITPGHKALAEKHGTPHEFAKACLAVIGDISVDEFHDAVNKYKQEWDAA